VNGGDGYGIRCRPRIQSQVSEPRDSRRQARRLLGERPERDDTVVRAAIDIDVIVGTVPRRWPSGDERTPLPESRFQAGQVSIPVDRRRNVSNSVLRPNALPTAERVAARHRLLPLPPIAGQRRGADRERGCRPAAARG